MEHPHRGARRPALYCPFIRLSVHLMASLRSECNNTPLAQCIQPSLSNVVALFSSLSGTISWPRRSPEGLLCPSRRASPDWSGLGHFLVQQLCGTSSPPLCNPERPPYHPSTSRPTGSAHWRCPVQQLCGTSSPPLCNPERPPCHPVHPAQTGLCVGMTLFSSVSSTI